MSADLLVRLRRAAMAPESLLAQAADEIERLRKPSAAPVSGDVALPEPLEIYWPDLNRHALGCGVEDRNIRDRYEAAEYGWQDGVDRAIECVPEQIYDADQLRTYGQQCSDAALERAAKLADDNGYGLIANRIRALKGGTHV